jgi:hypothetical protein
MAVQLCEFESTDFTKVWVLSPVIFVVGKVALGQVFS